MTHSQLNRRNSSNGPEPEAMMVPTPVPITEMMSRGQIDHLTEGCGANMPMFVKSLDLMLWMPGWLAGSFFSVVKKALQGVWSQGSL